LGFFSTVSFSQQLDPVLTELINKGLNKSQTVNIKAIEAQQAKLDQRLAKSVFIPKVTFNGSFTRLNDDITFGEDTQNLLVATQKLVIKEALQIPFNAPFPGEIPLKDTPNLQDKNILKTSVDLDWVLFSGFEATIAIKASKHKESSLKYLGMAEKDKLALKIIEAYDKLALVYASEKVLNTSEKYLDEQAFYVKKAIENGLATPIGRKKIELAQQQLAGKKLEFEHNKTLLIEVLFQLTGESRENLRMLRPELETFSLNSNSNVEKRNEIKALEEAEQATIYKSKMEKSHFIPKVAVKGHYEFIEDYLSLLDPKWYVGVGIKWNVFDGNQSNLKAQKSKLESEIYRERIEEAEEMIDLSIVKAEQTYQSTLQNSKIVEKEIELATDTYEMVNKQFKNDLASINEVLDALTNLEKANFKLQESYFDQRRAVTEMLHAKGTLKY
jgi:outer membrane protein TolC